jgi:L-lactate dehydrogenase complex protein LldE
VKASIFITCVCDIFFPHVGEAMTRILEKQGVILDFPPEQICCGQPAFNSGDWNDARNVARTVLDAFKDSEYIVAPAGSCLSAIKEYYPLLFENDHHYKPLADRIVSRVYEFSTFMVQVLGVEDIGARFPYKVTYHPSCHTTRLLGADPYVHALLKNIKDMSYVELPHGEMCCGFGGTFSVKLPEISEAMVDEKASNIIKTGADVLVGTDMSCLMNIGGRLRKQGSPIKVMHIAELLDEGMTYEPNTRFTFPR